MFTLKIIWGPRLGCALDSLRPSQSLVCLKNLIGQHPTKAEI